MPMMVTNDGDGECFTCPRRARKGANCFGTSSARVVPNYRRELPIYLTILSVAKYGFAWMSKHTQLESNLKPVKCN
eukprot:6384823-Amphidinium_carterae.1